MQTNLNFKSWLTTQYEYIAADYKMRLGWVVKTVQSYAEGNIFEPHHVDVGIACLREVKPLTLSKYPGEATEEDRGYFSTAKRPDYLDIRGAFENEIRKLCR